MPRCLISTAYLASLVLLPALAYAQIDHDATVERIEAGFTRLEQNLSDASETVAGMFDQSTSGLVEDVWGLPSSDEPLLLTEQVDQKEMRVTVLIDGSVAGDGSLSVHDRWLAPEEAELALDTRNYLMGWLVASGGFEGRWVALEMAGENPFILPGVNEIGHVLVPLAVSKHLEELEAFWGAWRALEGENLDEEMKQLVEDARGLVSTHQDGAPTEPNCYDGECLDQATEDWGDALQLCRGAIRSCRREARQVVQGCVLACAVAPTPDKPFCLARCAADYIGDRAACTRANTDCRSAATSAYNAARRDCRQ